MSDNAGAQGTPSTGEKAPGSPPNASSKPAEPEAKPKPKGNPAFRALGFPNLRLRLPSRNWMIFLSIVGSWTGAVVYDRRQKKAAQQKWCSLVEHVAQESLPTTSLARRVTILLAAPPGDSVRPARQHFTEYVKPVLVAGGLDWDVIEGRREGEVRNGIAEKIRRLRRRKGDPANSEIERDVNSALADVRARSGVEDYPGPLGDIVIGRHTWKEYVRGLHEGWLGPIDAPKPPEESTPSPESPSATTTNPNQPSTAAESEAPSNSGRDDGSLVEQLNSDSPNTSTADSQSSPTADSQETPAKSDEAEKKADKEKKDEKPKKPPVPVAHNTTASYTDSALPPSFPRELPASVPIPFPHMLGVVNTPKRIYRFLTRRRLADEVGRQTAAAVLAAYRPYHHGAAPLASGDESSEFSTETMGDAKFEAGREEWEQQQVLVREEPEWYKKARKRTEGEGERVWLDAMVVDPRIGGRMRKFELELAEEERARRIRKGAKGSPGRRAGEDGESDGESQL